MPDILKHTHTQKKMKLLPVAGDDGPVSIIQAVDWPNTKIIPTHTILYSMLKFIHGTRQNK